MWGAGALLALSLPFLLFPDGHVPSKRWRVVAWASVIGVVTFVVATALAPGPIADTPLPNPVGLELGGAGRTIFPFLRGSAAAITVLAGIASVASLFFRYRRGTRTEREQLRWLLLVGALIVLGIPLQGAIGSLAASPTAAVNFQNAATAFSLTFIPIAIGIAILKYRLYDIDIVISKTLVYGSLAAFITVVYVGVVVGLGSLVRANFVLSVAATAIVAVLFQPVRERVQRWANRLVYGQRATPYEVLSRFSDRVTETYATGDVLLRTARVIAEGTGARLAQVWLRVGSEWRNAARWPDEADLTGATRLPAVAEDLPVFPGIDTSVPVRYHDELLGAVAVAKPPDQPLTPGELGLLEDLAQQAGLVLSNVRLTSELNTRIDEVSARAEELRASRRRVVSAHDAERRRLERNIHDGAQQHLVALAVKLRLVRGMLERDPEKARAMLGELRGEVDDAIETLSSLALGIYPPVLEEQGLGAALEAQAKITALPVTIDTDGVGRQPIETEAAMYFCCLEAMQNIAKYAGASHVSVVIGRENGSVTFEVRDDGRGFDPATTPRGSGLQNMIDRLSAMGGTLETTSAPGSGTTIKGTLPVEEGVR